jgi:hypothetical protein
VEAVKWRLSGGGCQVEAVRWRLSGGGCQVEAVRWRLSGGSCQVEDVQAMKTPYYKHEPQSAFQNTNTVPQQDHDSYTCRNNKSSVLNRYSIS